jgi:hypothetical protein
MIRKSMPSGHDPMGGYRFSEKIMLNQKPDARFADGRLQITAEAFIRNLLLLEPGRICMITSYSQIASSRPKPMLDACFAL